MTVRCTASTHRISPPCSQIAAWFLFVLGANTSWPIEAKDFALADWAVPIQNQLPPVSKEIISEVDDLLAIMNDERHGSFEGGIPYDDIFYRAARQMVELRDLGEHALLWQYVKAPEPGVGMGQLAMSRNQILRAIEYNPDMVPWVLPLARARVDSLAKKMQAQRGFMPSDSNELVDIKRYFYSQGELKDIKSVDDIFASAVANGYVRGDSRIEQTMEEQMPQIERVKARVRKAASPHWKLIAQGLIADGKLDKSFLSADVGVTKGSSSGDNLPQMRPSSAPKTTTQPAEVPQLESKSWLMWLLVVIMATAGAVWVFLRKSK